MSTSASRPAAASSSILGRVVLALGSIFFLHAAYSTYEFVSVQKSLGLIAGQASGVPYDVRGGFRDWWAGTWRQWAQEHRHGSTRLTWLNPSLSPSRAPYFLHAHADQGRDLCWLRCRADRARAHGQPPSRHYLGLRVPQTVGDGGQAD